MAPERVTSPNRHAIARCFGTALKFALIGAVAVGTLAFIHVAWDSYKFQASGEVPVDDPRFIFLGITILGVLVGGALGAVLGVGVGLLRRGKS
jgi:hypothetical protein